MNNSINLNWKYIEAFYSMYFDGTYQKHPWLSLKSMYYVGEYLHG